ncbi:MAG: site-specific integrase, partial [Thermoplasmata archaeon]
MNKDYKGWTLQGYLTTLKKFYKWLNGNDEYPECVKWIKKLPNNKLNGKPEPVITEEEYHTLIKACKNLRDKAMISLLWDSGMRIGELLSMKVSDWTNDQYGAVAIIQGKTGSRRVRIIGDSMVYVNEWLNQEHPDKNNSSSPLFTLRNNTNGEIEYATFRKVLLSVQKQAGINRRIHPHLFRHTTATRYAGSLTEQILESQMGWVHGSKMTNTYVHLSGRDIDREVLKANGIEMQGEKDRIKQQLPKKCKRCDKENPSDATFCIRCGMPFDEKIALNYEHKIDMIESTVKSLGLDPMV